MTSVMAKNRIKHRFDKWDADGNGLLERSDMEREAAEIAHAFGKGPSSPEGETITAAYRGLYDLLAGHAGATDGAITEDQFRHVAEDLIFEQGEAAFNRALTPLVEGIIALCDKNADGRINRDEFQNWLSVFNHTTADADEAFDQIDRNSNGELTTDELLAAVRDYHFGKLNVELIAI